MAGGNNLLSGKKSRSATYFICRPTRILARHLIVNPHCVFNWHGTQFISNITLGTSHARVNQHGAGTLDNRLDSTFGDAVMMSNTRSTKVDVLVLFK